jgi:hypothetical protein
VHISPRRGAWRCRRQRERAAGRLLKLSCSDMTLNGNSSSPPAACAAPAVSKTHSATGQTCPNTTSR